MDVQTLKSMSIIQEYLVRSITLEHQKVRKRKLTAPIKEEQNTDYDVVIIDKEVQD